MMMGLQWWIKLCLVLGSVMGDEKTSTQAFQIVLGGKSCSTTGVEESGGYLTSDFKTQVLEPIMKRVASHVYKNFETIELNKVMAGTGLAWMTVITLYIVFFRCTSGCQSLSDRLEKGDFEPKWISSIFTSI